mmetsp:Transcript_380/g.683  ORF Transcript_380/g.683 Transcript_380/m.683 type:complete len:90 (+) Transcript_380:227-496(+)|eukprot:CAMPEP_0184296944 /NCGR_PEP_ID=MMETSP1049-20130417/7889_1 /TAXON_ID=77928 /ORGANISM="Proteomonas sulcata, Strain CCMP704" /LENGTH=89 /DNA_ID=CAMNT_0026606429 /DNA_START=221 /DNA_END=490 /DNA_ORIENTATION=+
MDLFPTEEDIVLQLSDRVAEAQRVATQQLKEQALKKNGKRSRDDEEDEDADGSTAVAHHKKKGFNKGQKRMPGGFKGNSKSKKFAKGGK